VNLRRQVWSLVGTHYVPPLLSTLVVDRLVLETFYVSRWVHWLSKVKKGPPRPVITNSWVLSEPQEIVAHHTAHQLNLPLWGARSGRVRITYHTFRPGHNHWGRGAQDDSVFVSKPIPLSNVSLFLTLAIPLPSKWEKRKASLVLIPAFDPFHLCPVGRDPCREWRGAKDLTLQSASIGSTLSPESVRLH